MRNKLFQPRWPRTTLFIFVTLLWTLIPLTALAQDDGAVQELTGQVARGGGAFYTLPDLSKGQRLSVYVEGTSSNLDPIVGLTESGVDGPTLQANFQGRVAAAVDSGEDPLVALPQILDELFLAWDDDSGDGYDAALAFTVPDDGDYQLLITSSPVGNTAGDFRLLVGLDVPGVLGGKAAPTGDTIAILNVEASRTRVIAQQLEGSLTADRLSQAYTLRIINPGETLYAYVESTSGDLAPRLALEDYGGKPIRSGNFSGEASQAALQYTFEDRMEDAMLRVEACCEGATVTTGDYRLLVGINEPAVLDGALGEGAASEDTIIREPIDVQVGVRMQQITSVDQKAENFGVVATMQMRWTDPQLAFSPDSCDCTLKTYSFNDFVKLVTDNDILWPAFTLFNQQGNRWSQNQWVVITSEGEALYFERFSTTLQAPDFDFRRFPFDSQDFYIRIDSLYPEEYFLFSDLGDFSQLGEQLGEEEWVITETETTITSQTASTQREAARFSFRFKAERHLSFYVIRIFIPILLILSVSWITFFLKDYGKRVDVSAGNLLLFIAFNFTISGDLPRLGYLTFLDVILISTFVVTGLVVIFNVILKRLELSGKMETAQRIDRYTLWLYPLSYIAAVIIVINVFT